MGKFNPAADLDNYSSSGSFFSLKDDGDSRIVHFMYNGIADLDGYAVHNVDVNGTKRLVNCIREYSDPLDKCPLCEARYKIIPKFFINLYDPETNEQFLWQRGQNFYSQFADLCAGCNPLVSYPVEIVRHGVKGDVETTYEFLVGDDDGLTLEDCPEPVDPLGTAIINATYDELLTYVQTGSLITGDNNPVNKQQSSDVVESRRRRDVSGNGVRRASTNSDIPL